MKSPLTTLIFPLLLLTLLPLTYAATNNTFYKGINARHFNSTGGFKTRDEWLATFARISALPGPFTAVRTYSTQEGGYRPLPWLIDASQTHSLDLLLGLYLDDGRARTLQQNLDTGRFAVEFDMLKQGLEYAASIGALANVIGISVGNEDLHRGAQRPGDIAGMIARVREWLRVRFPDVPCIPVGHADTWAQIVNESNSAVAEASDFLAANAFPYWEEVPVERAAAHFGTTMMKMDEVSKKYGIPVFLGETGWPTDGQYKSVIGSVAGLQKYWNEVFCSESFKGRHAFYYIVDDYGFVPDGPHWGILDEQQRPLIKLECPGQGPTEEGAGG